MAIVDANGDAENGYTYDVYGEPAAAGSLANEFDFAGQQTDGSTGLQYLRARYYDPATRVFLSREPLAVRQGWIQSPFGYSRANPARYLDPTGLVLVDSGDGCGRGSCLDTNDVIPHADGTWFKEYRGRTQFCLGFQACVDLDPEDFNLRQSCSITISVVVCFNQFGGITETRVLQPGKIGEEIKKIELACVRGAVSTFASRQAIRILIPGGVWAKAVGSCIGNAIGETIS